MSQSPIAASAASSANSNPEMINLLDRVLLFMKFRHIKKNLIP